MMDAESVRNMLSDLAVTNKQYCQSCILLVFYIIYYLSDQIEKNEMDEASSMYGGE